MEGAQTAPLGWKWFCNGESKFSPNYESKLVQVGKTECELFAEQTLKNNGTWYRLDGCAEGSWYETQSWHLINNNYYGDTPVYQVFDRYGHRVFGSTNMYSAAAEFEKLSQKEGTHAGN